MWEWGWSSCFTIGALLELWGLRIALVAYRASRIIVSVKHYFYITTEPSSIPSRTSSDSAAMIGLVRGLGGGWRGAHNVGHHASLLAPLYSSGVYA